MEARADNAVSTETTATASPTSSGRGCEEEEGDSSATAGTKRCVTDSNISYQVIFVSCDVLQLTPMIFLDMTELDLPSTMKIEYPDENDQLNFFLIINPDEGMYKNGSFRFNFAINQNFPHDPPKVKCTQKIYHPNIDLEGNVCLNILREDWKPVLNLNAVLVGLQVRAKCSQNLKPDRE